MEFVLAIRRGDLFGARAPQGFEPYEEQRFLAEVVDPIRRRGFFVERAAAETEPLWKQVIPYCILRRGDDVFVTTRLPAQGEKRLHGLRSIGIGGHVNPADGGEDRLLAGLRREVEEEVELEPGWVARPLGLVNDDTTEVGSVHVGLVFGIRPVRGRVAVREVHKMCGGFEPLVEIADLCKHLAVWESWSRLILVRAQDWMNQF